jgi:hypothetical protein
MEVSGQLNLPAALPGKTAPGGHWIGDWVGPRASVDDVEMRKFLTYRDSNSDLLIVQPVSYDSWNGSNYLPQLH